MLPFSTEAFLSCSTAARSPVVLGASPPEEQELAGVWLLVFALYVASSFGILFVFSRGEIQLEKQ